MKSYAIETGNPCEQLIVSNIRFSYEDFAIGSPYNTTFNIKVNSGDFAGVSEFEYNIKDFVRFIEELKELYEFKISQVELNDICHGSNIIIGLNQLGHITISGTLYGNAMEHSLKFIFVTDQTAIKAFSKSLYNDFVIENIFNL